LDEAIVKNYRRLVRDGFKNAGSYENPSILLSTIASGIRICGGAGGYIRIYLDISDGAIEGARYLCSCDPTSNVAVEIFCDLLSGKTLEEAAALTEGMFLQALDGPSNDLRKKARALIKILNDGIKQYRVGRS